MAGQNNKKSPEEAKHSTVPEALDGGYGWVIVVAAFLIHVIVDGASFGYGVVSKHIKEYYQVSESEATLVGSLQLGFYLLSCPFAGKMVEKLGFRITCFTGSLLATLGFALAQVSPNIVTIMLTYGVMAGSGFGLMYLSSISAVTLYFDKKRVLATSLATCGSGLGMFAFSAICGKLIELFDWKNALLIVGGLALQGCVVAMLLRPLEDFQKSKQKKIKYSSKVKDGNEITASLLDLPDGNKTPPAESNDVVIFQKENGKTTEVTSSPHNSKETNIGKTDLVIKSLHDLGSSLKNIEEKTDSHMANQATKSKVQAPKLTSKQKAAKVLRSFMDISLMKEPIFYIICVANIFAFLGTCIPLKFQVDRALTYDIASTEAERLEMADFLVSVSGIANTVGRATSALLDVNRNISKTLVHNLAVLVCGIACFFNFLSVKYSLMVVFASVFTFSLGVYIALSSVVVCEMLGPEAVNNAFALMCMLRGFANIAGGPIAGAAYDKLQNYDVCFYIGGAMMTMGGICFCLLLLPKIQKRSFKNLLHEEDPGHSAMITSMVNVFAAKDQGTPRLARANVPLAIGSIHDLQSSRLNLA